MAVSSPEVAAITVEQVQSWGVVGAGGAGFPTHIKLKATADTIILNAAECEPLLHKDKELLRAYGAQVLAGLEVARRLVGAKQAVVGIKYKYHDVIDALTKILPPNTSIKELSDSYPAGDEFILVYDVTGRVIPPGKIPLVVGCVVMNVETALNIARQRAVTTKFLTIAGAVKQPMTVEVPLGVTFRETIALAGGPTVPDPVFLVGGAMMGQFSDDFNRPITKTTGGLIVLNRDHPLIERYTKTTKAIKIIGASACDQCSFCTYFCPRYLLGHPIEPHKNMRSLGFNLVGDANIMGSSFCCECNVCTMVACPEDLDPKNVVVMGKRQLASQNKRWEGAEADPDRAELHLDNRRVPIARLIQKLGLHHFENTGPLHDGTVKATKVTLPLKQHAGAAAVAAVTVGQTVSVGDVIAQPAAGALGAVIHASVAGRVASVGEAVVIEV